MGYEKEVLQRARARHRQAVEAHREARRRQQEEIRQDLPDAFHLERRIQGTMAQVIASALRQGEDPTPRLRALREENLSLQAELQELLLENDYPADALDEKPLCPKCGDSGYVGESMCDCLRDICREEQKKELTSLLSNQASFDDFSLDYYPTAVNPATGMSPRQIMEMIYNSCVNFAIHFRPGRSANLLLTGNPGLGKTFLSACIAREVVQRGFSVVYDSAAHVFSCLEDQKFGRADDEALRMAQRVFACDLLILDDLGTEMASSFVCSALYSLLNTRLMEEKPTIISTNLSLEQLSQRYTGAIASRLEGEFRHLGFVGADIRILKKRAQ